MALPRGGFEGIIEGIRANTEFRDWLQSYPGKKLPSEVLRGIYQVLQLYEVDVEAEREMAELSQRAIRGDKDAALLFLEKVAQHRRKRWGGE